MGTPEQAGPAEARPRGVVGNVPRVGPARLLAEVMDAMPTGRAAERGPLPLTDKQAIVSRALLLLSSLYPHLASKRLLYAIDPVQALTNLGRELADRGESFDEMPETEFHDRMTAIFASLRDRHTNYYLPQPYRGTIAFLPFLIEAATDDHETTYYVTKAATGFPLPDGFPVGEGHDQLPVVVTHWNGVPIARAVARSAERSAGANRAARTVRGLDRMTFRWLGLGTGPDEEWVDLTFQLAGQSRTVQFKWYAVRREAPYPNAAREGAYAMALGGDPEGEWIRLVRQGLFTPDPDTDPDPDDADRALRYREIPVGGKQYGHLRIFTFDCDDPSAFVASVRTHLEKAPEQGLIVDLRGNPGGNLLVAEALPPMFVGAAVPGQGLQFVNTSEAITVAERIVGASEMTTYVSYASSTAAPFISCPPLTWPGGPAANANERAYAGPVAVIVDANCFSAAEAFVAAMQDHNPDAVIIGTHPQTGGGGGNVLPDAVVPRRWKGRPLQPPLAHGASFDIALRRTTRTGEHAGVALEDMGVVVLSGDIAPITKVDLSDKNSHLLSQAASKLRGTDDEDR